MRFVTDNGIELHLITYEEAKTLGIPCDELPPENPSECQFCGKPLEYKGLVRNGKIKEFRASHCFCKEARLWRDKVSTAETMDLIREGMRKRRQEQIDNRQDGVSKRLKVRTFETYETKTDKQQLAKSVAVSYCQNFTRSRDLEQNGIFFFGDTGCGKTHLACAIANHLGAKGEQCLFSTFEEMLLAIRDTYSKDGSDFDVRNTYKTAPLLILDDLAKEKSTEFSTSVLFDIMNSRYENLRPTIITANHDHEALLHRLTPSSGDDTKAAAIVSRIREMCYAVNMTGMKDYRCK